MPEKVEEIQNRIDNIAMAKKNVIALVDCDSFSYRVNRRLIPNSKESLSV